MVIANFTNEQDARVTGLDQYDYGQVLRIQGLKLPTAVEIHFGLEETGGTTTTRIGVTKDGVTDVVIPDSMLENGDTSLDYTIYAFIYLTDDTSGKTVHRIKMQVNARSKPEQFDRPSDTELFREAIKAVNQSAKEAEGWAHGREDMPERATDNAKYYAGESAKSAESVKGVEQNVKDMVATIGGIEQQVQDVKKYAGQAQSASEKALLSEQEAKKSEEASLQHRTGAEVAENNAELAEQNAKKSEQAVEQAKTLVIQMGQQVLDNKNHVDGKVEAFNKVATDASDAINTKKTESLTEIETAKTNAVGAVGTKGTEQAKKVEDEGTKQVGAVNTEAQKHLKAMQDAVNGIVADRQQITQNKEDVTTLKEDLKGFVPKNQGVENNGKILGIGEDGLVVPIEKPSGGSGGGVNNYELLMEVTIEEGNESTNSIEYKEETDALYSEFLIVEESAFSAKDDPTIGVYMKQGGKHENISRNIYDIQFKQDSTFKKYARKVKISCPDCLEYSRYPIYKNGGLYVDVSIESTYAKKALVNYLNNYKDVKGYSGVYISSHGAYFLPKSTFKIYGKRCN